ncbi:MAG: TfoX/Sxy family protein [Acidobacteriota bacterium]
MPVSRDFLDFVLEQLEAVGELRPQRLFGGIGLYSRELFFGLLHDDVLFLKVDETTRPAYLAAGMGPFRPIAEQPDYAMHGYYEVPADVLEDRDALANWARLSLAIAATAPKAKPRAARPRKKAPAKPRQAAARSAKAKRRPAAGARRRSGGGGSKRPRGR